MVAVLAALLVAAVLAAHRAVPDVAGLGTAVDSFLPWLGLAVLPVALYAALARSRSGLLAVAVPVLVWAALFVPYLVPRAGGTPQLRAVTQNLAAGNPDQARTARQLVTTGADLVAVQELESAAAAGVLDRAYRHRLRVGTVGLWSRYPLRGGTPVDLGFGWNRALRAEAVTRWGTVTVYTVHLASVRPGVYAARDRTLGRLADRLAADRSPHLLVLGDLNTATTDRALDRLVPPLHDAARDAGGGLGFTWPAAFPMTRPDQLLYRGLTVTGAGTDHTAGSDHRAARAGFRVS